MFIIPAVDIKDKKCVRLFQGKADRETVYSSNPVEFALKWEEEGATFLHVVDLNGAFEGTTANMDIIADIVSHSKKIKIEVGGGIRSLDTIKQYLDIGVYRVIIGTKALDENFLQETIEKFGEKIVVGIDAKDGYVVTQGWVTKTQTNGVDLVKKVEKLGVRRVIYTDISFDGTLKGPNIQGMKDVLNATSMQIIASGGISKLDDFKQLKAIGAPNLEGVIVGKALYTGDVNLKQALKIFE